MTSLFTGIGNWFDDQVREHEKDFHDLSKDIREESIRTLIVMTAADQANKGAHYLTGTYGAMPGEADHVAYRQVDLIENQAFDSLAIHTARRNGAKKNCLGRYLHKDVVGRKVTDHDELDRLEEKTLERIADGLPATDWPTHDGLYPRRGGGSHVYLGEDCRGKRHFDCIGFVNWVLSETLGRRFRYEVFQYEGNKNDSDRHAAPVKVTRNKPFPAAKNGDIVTKITWKVDVDDRDKDNNRTEYYVSHDHIGFLTADGNVIHASSEKKGVIITKYKPSEWTAHCRLHKRELRLGCEHLPEKKQKKVCY